MQLYNDEKSGYERLAGYYPLYYKNVYEMQEILKAQGRLADDMKSGIERVLSDCFIDTMDSASLSTYEEILGISSAGNTIDERRRLVKSYLIGSGKISASVIRSMIKAYTGTESECEFTQTEAYGTHKLIIRTDRGSKEKIDLNDVNKFLSEKLPAHIEYIFALVYNFPLELSFETQWYEKNCPECGQFFCGQSIPF